MTKNRFLNICKNHVLGYTVQTCEGNYDKNTLDYVAVTVQFYIKRETSNVNVNIIRNYTNIIINDMLIEKMSYLKEIDPNEVSYQIRSEDKACINSKYIE